MCMQTIISKRLSGRNQSIDSQPMPEATQNRYSLALFSEPGRQARDQLSNNFDVRLVSVHTPINHFDCCMIDCRGQKLAEPALVDIETFDGVKFVLVDESTIILDTAKAITGQYQLITENDFNSPILTMRVSTHTSTNLSRTTFEQNKAETATPAIIADKLAAASHDIRQPLQAMSLFIHSLESKLSNDQQRGILMMLQQSAVSLNTTLDDMLGLLIPDMSPKKNQLSKSSDTKNKHITHSGAAARKAKPLHDYTVMVLDNNEEIVLALESSLQDAGLHVYPATNLDEACQIINEIDQLPDMLLVDFNLDNDCKGDDAIKTICDTAKKVIPSIVITSETCASKLHRAQEIANTVLRKPVHAEHLLATISHFIDEPAPC